MLRWHRLYCVATHILNRVLDAQQAGEVAAAAGLEEDLAGNLLLLVPFCDVRLDLGFNPFANLGSESGVRFVEVRRVILVR